MAEEREWIHGATIDKWTKALRFASVSSLDLADHAAGGCQRKWHYRYVQKFKDPPSDKQKRGIECHANVASYLTVPGFAAINADVARGLHMVPKPGPDLLVEWDLLKRPDLAYPGPLTYAHSSALLANAPLKIDGVPLLGSIDLAHARGENQGAASPEEARDPDGTVEVCDWKFVGSDRYMKKAGELTTLTQLVGYAGWVWQVRPQTPFVRISLGYFPTRGQPRKVSRLIRRDDILPRLDHLVGVVRTIGQIAREEDVERVPANTEACDAYGGCLHKLEGRCTAPMRKSLADLIGITAAEACVVPAPTQAPEPRQGLIPVASLLQRANPTGVQAGVQVAPAPAPSAADIAAEKAKLAAEQQAARLKATIPPGFVEAVGAIKAFNRGFPNLWGFAARAYWAMSGKEYAPNDAIPEIAGEGEIDYVRLDDPKLLPQLVEDLRANPAPAQAPAPAPAPAPAVSPLPPDAPPSDPALAAQGGVPQSQAIAGASSASPPVVLQMPAMQTSPDPMKAEPEAPKAKGRGKAKSEPQAPVPAESGDALHIYIDCATTRQTTSLNDWAQECADQLAKAAGAVDVRCGGEDTALGYDKWKGALVAFVRDATKTPLAPGSYRLDVRFSSVMQAVAEGLELRVRGLANGSTVTRGVR